MIELIKMPEYFTPIAEHSERFKKLRDGESYVCDIATRENYRFHCKIMATIRMLYENTNNWTDFDRCKDYLKAKLNYCEHIVIGDKAVIQLKELKMSTSMKSKQEFYEKLVPFVATVLGCSESDVKQNWSEYAVD